MNDGLLYIAAVILIVAIGFVAAIIISRMGARESERAWATREAEPAPIAPAAESSAAAKPGTATA